jgi:hypothetical protein
MHGRPSSPRSSIHIHIHTQTEHPRNRNRNGKHTHLDAIGGGVGVELPFLVFEALSIGLRAFRLLAQEPHVCLFGGMCMCLEECVCVCVYVCVFVCAEESLSSGRPLACTHARTHARTHAPMGRGFSLSSINSASASRRFSTPGGRVGHRNAASKGAMRG